MNLKHNFLVGNEQIIYKRTGTVRVGGFSSNSNTIYIRWGIILLSISKVHSCNYFIQYKKINTMKKQYNMRGDGPGILLEEKM